MINFFKNIFTSTPGKKIINNKNDDFIKLYFDRNKLIFMDVKILSHTCQELHSLYHNEISSVLYNTTQNYKLNTSEYAFVIIDDENIYTEIKLKVSDIPINFLRKKSINLYYLSLNKVKDDNNNQTEDIAQSHTIHESIREGELLKYSFKHKRFDKRIVTLDKEKLIINKPKIVDTTVILLSEISSISRDISNKNERALREKYLFEVITYEGEHYVFKSKCNADHESWIESICTVVGLVRDNKYLIKYGDDINKIIKDTYDKSMKIIYNCLGLKGIISLKETRTFLFDLYVNPLLSKILENIIQYKLNVRFYKYFNAWQNYLEIYSLFEIDSIKILIENTDNDINLSRRKSSHEIIKDRKVLVKKQTYEEEINLIENLNDNFISEDRISNKPIIEDDKNEIFIKKLASNENIELLRTIKNEITEIMESIKDNESRNNNETNSKLFELMKPHIFHEIYDNILLKYFNNFYKEMSVNKDFISHIELILSYFFKEKNNFVYSSVLNLENYTQQSFYSRMTLDNDVSPILSGITSENILQKSDQLLNNSISYNSHPNFNI